jgi:hypothetical protein
MEPAAGLRRLQGKGIVNAITFWNAVLPFSCPD